MPTSIRDALHSAAEGPVPPSNIDIDAALARGRRRHARKQSALAAAGALAAAITVWTGSTLITAGPQPATPAAPAFGAPTSQHGCVLLDQGIGDAVRAVLRPPGDTWSVPPADTWLTPGVQPEDVCSEKQRFFSVEVTQQGQDGIGRLKIGLDPLHPVPFGHSRCADWPPSGRGGECHDIPEGTLWLDPVETGGPGRPMMQFMWASLLTSRKMFIKVFVSNCPDEIENDPSAPCLNALPYTGEQLGQVAAAVARELDL